MIRCVRMWTGEDGDSLFEEGSIDLPQGTRGDSVGEPVPARELSFQETKSGGSYEWHQDPVPRFVLTLSGTLEFQTKSGATFTIRPGDVLLAQDNTGTGHKWKLVGDDPWRRAYVVYENGADLHFTSSRRTKAALIERVADEVIGGADPAQGSGLTGRTPGARRMPSALPP